MALNIFLYFPETDDEIVRLSHNANNCINEFVKISTELKKHQDFNFYYDNENIDAFFTKTKLVGVYFNSPKFQIQTKLQKIPSKSINEHKVRRGDCQYYIWNLSEAPTLKTRNIFSELTERYFIYPEPANRYLVLNMLDAMTYCRERILMFRDAIHEYTFPEKFAHVDFVSNYSEFELWISTKQKSEFSLLNRFKFKRTTFVQHGKPVFAEISTGNYWYIDNFHKNEYEVFDSLKKHIGIANLAGIIIPGSAIKGRTF